MLSVISRSPRRVIGMMAAALALSLGACKDDATGIEEDEPEVESMRLTIAGQTVTIAANGAVTGAPVTLPVGTHAISAQFLDTAGQPVDGVDAVEFQLNVTIPSGSPVTFTRSTTNAFAGTLTVSAAAATVALRFALFHVEEQHEDFGPFPVSFTFTN
jgi:hypothetical protein